jgi:hypothetical protein
VSLVLLVFVFSIDARVADTAFRSRFQIFTEGGQPARKSNLTQKDIGSGPYRRFADAIALCVEFEDEARARLLPANWS